MNGGSVVMAQWHADPDPGPARSSCCSTGPDELRDTLISCRHRTGAPSPTEPEPWFVVGMRRRAESGCRPGRYGSHGVLPMAVRACTGAGKSP